MSWRSGDVKGGAMKTMEFGVLSVLLSMAAHGGISDALSASAPPPPQTPVPPSSSAATPPAPDAPARGTVPDAPAGSPRHPKSAPMPAPAPTDHFAGSLENFSGPVILPKTGNEHNPYRAGADPWTPFTAH